MLSKSAAKKFFLTGTVLCAGAFVLLTFDTLKQIPRQTHEENLTPAAIRGKHLFDRNNCMGCHTIMGEGAYYAPELTKVFERRGESFIKAMLKDPAAMYPGERKMQKYDFSEQDMDDLVAFFKWIGEMDLNGFPAKPDMMSPNPPAATTVRLEPGAPAPATAAAPPKIFGQMCVACHALGGSGGKIGPALDTIGATRDKAFLAKWLRDPMAIKADSRMPKLPLSESDIEDLATFLASRK